MEKLLQYCCTETGCDRAEVEAVINAFLDGIVCELSKGHSVDLGDAFGVFSVSLREGSVNEGSPRKPKASRYRTFFRENKGMRRRLKIAEKTNAEEAVCENIQR